MEDIKEKIKEEFKKDKADNLAISNKKYYLVFYLVIIFCYYYNYYNNSNINFKL